MDRDVQEDLPSWLNVAVNVGGQLAQAVRVLGFGVVYLYNLPCLMSSSRCHSQKLLHARPWLAYATACWLLVGRHTTTSSMSRALPFEEWRR
jgi:hypothetical protein